MRESGKIVGDAARRDEIERIRPTLLIGLGGTGREVLLRLRQRFVERYGIAKFPAMAYVWIDTDVDNPETVEGKPRGFLTSQARLHGSEMVDATVTAEDFMNYFENAQQHPHIFSWIYPSLSKSGSVLHGARAVRPLGRLAFFHNSAKIRRAILSAVNEIVGADKQEEMRSTYGIEVAADALNVIVVYSVAGGTGSGMFLDLAFMIRHLGRSGGIPLSPNSIGYLVLPPVFAPEPTENERFYANGYAALKELEYYSMRKDQRYDTVREARPGAERVGDISAHDFQVDWENSGTPLNIVGPPFNSCFLVGNGPDGDASVPPDRKGDIFDMIAETIFVDFSRQEFATRKRSMRSNLEDYLKNDLEYSYLQDREAVFRDVFSFRFSTFGLSKLYVPVDRIRRACGYKLSLDMLDRWLAPNVLKGDLRGYLNEHEVDPLGLRVSSQRDALREQLDRVDDAGHTLGHTIQQHWEVERRDELRERVRQEKPGLKAALAQELAKFQKTYFNKPDERAHWGLFIRRLHQVTRPHLEEDLQARLHARLHEWLNTPSIRLSQGVEFLKEVSRILGDLQEAYTRASAARTQRSADSLRDWQSLLEVVDEEETQGAWTHRWSLRALVVEACSTAVRYFEDLAYAELYAVGAEACAAMRRYVGSEQVEVDRRGDQHVVRSGLIHQLFLLQEHLLEIRGELTERLAAFDRVEDHLVFVNLYRPGAFESYYKLARPDGSGSAEPVNDEVLENLEPQLRGELEIQSPYDLLGRIREHDLSFVREQIEEFGAHRFRQLDARSADAVFLLNELPGKGTQEITRLVQRGNAWLRPSRRAREGGSPLAANYEAGPLLGLSRVQQGHSRYVAFEQGVAERAVRLPALKSRPLQTVDTDPDSVFFYTELAGLPLAYVEKIENYRGAYRAQIEEFLHLDRHTDRFTDVVLKTQEEVALAVRVNRALLLGIILRLIEVSGKGSDAVLLYVDKRSFPPLSRYLGTRLDAFELLASDPGLLDVLESEIEQRRRKLDPTQREQFFTLLGYHVLDGQTLGVSDVGPFAPRHVRVGEARAVKMPVENRAIREALGELERQFSDRAGISEPEDLEKLRSRIFHQWYPRRAEFGEPVLLGGDTLLVFRNNPTPEQPRSAAEEAHALG